MSSLLPSKISKSDSFPRVANKKFHTESTSAVGELAVLNEQFLKGMN